MERLSASEIQANKMAIYWSRAGPEGEIDDCMLPLERNKDGYATFGHVGRHCFPKRCDGKKLKAEILNWIKQLAKVTRDMYAKTLVLFLPWAPPPFSDLANHTFIKAQGHSVEKGRKKTPFCFVLFLNP